MIPNKVSSFQRTKKKKGKRKKKEKKANPQKNVLLSLVQVTRKTFNSYLVIKTFRSNFSLYGIREFFVDVPQPYDVFSDSFVSKKPHILTTFVHTLCDFVTGIQYPVECIFLSFSHSSIIVVVFTVSTYILFEFFFIQFTAHLFYFVNFISHVWPILWKRKISRYSISCDKMHIIL